MGVNIKKSRESVKLHNNLSKGKDAKSFSEFLNLDLSFTKGLSDKKKFRFYNELRLLISAGIDIRMSLQIAIEAEKTSKTKIVLEEVYSSIILGKTFSEALKGTNKFSEYEYYSIKIGEESGTIIIVLNDLSNFYEGRIELKRRMVSALSYPVIVLVTALLAVVFMLSFIVPIFEDAFKRFGGELPYLTQKVLRLSEFIQSYGVGSLFVVLILAVLLFSQTKKIWFRKFLSELVMKIPVLGEIIQKTYLSRFCHSMSLLIKVNNPLIGSIAMVRKMIRFFPLEQALLMMERDILDGALLYESMAKHSIFPGRMISLVKVAEEVNKLAIVFEQIQLQYENETENSSKTIGSLMEPFLIIFIGLFVGIILVAMYLPLFELGSGIK